MKRYGLYVIALATLAGCTSKSADKATGGTGQPSGDSKNVPSFSLAWSEYPSWSIFDVASEQGLIDGSQGKQGELEKKWKIDIVLKAADYDQCISFYGSNQADAVCITNMDILGPADGRPSVAILPTSTSVGADACISVVASNLDELKGKKTLGLERSVSQYAFERLLTVKGKNPADYPFENMDPAAAASAMQSGNAEVPSIMVWNPFVMQTLRTKADAKLIFDSSEIPEEIIDMVVVGKDVLAKEGGRQFALAVIDIYYTMNKRLADPKTADDTLIGIGAKFSSLNLEDMKKVVTQTRFYKSADEALKLMESSKFQTETMPAVAKFCVEHKIVEREPTIGFSKAEASINFDSSFLKAYRDGETSAK